MNALDALDRHNFDRVDSSNTLDTLYAKVFPVPANKDKCANYNNWSEVLVQDEAIIRLLCEWAVTTKRCGEHRALVVAKLLEKRQADLTIEVSKIFAILFTNKKVKNLPMLIMKDNLIPLVDNVKYIYISDP